MKHIVLITDAFPPSCTSGAIQVGDLARELVRHGHKVTVLVPASNQKDSWILEEYFGVKVLRLRSPRTKDIGYCRRTLAEILMPFAMLLQLRQSPLADQFVDGVVWYSPSIFHGPLASALKRDHRCKSYLIIRDIFPQWAFDTGLIGRGLPYLFFDLVARYQYSVADTVGVQSVGNLSYFADWSQRSGRKLEVLQNWLGRTASVRCSIRVDDTPLAGRIVFIYTGTMGVAQGLDIFIALIEKLKNCLDIGFLFVGRGSEAVRLKTMVFSNQLSNVLFYDEIPRDEIPDLCSQCGAGIVALDHRHRSHNIPGKFLTYMQNGLPVLANVNPGNDIAGLIKNENVGEVCESNNLDELAQLAIKLLKNINTDLDIAERCRRFYEREFSVEKAVKQIVDGLTD